VVAYLANLLLNLLRTRGGLPVLVPGFDSESRPRQPDSRQQKGPTACSLINTHIIEDTG
jgi:hypothetical protein